MSDSLTCVCPAGPRSAAGCVEVRAAMVWARIIGDTQALKDLAAMLHGPCPFSGASEEGQA